MNLIHGDVLLIMLLYQQEIYDKCNRGFVKKVVCVRVCECERPKARGLGMTVALRNMLLLSRVTHVGN